MGYQTAPNNNFCPPYVFYQFMSHIEGTALLFDSKWLPSASHPPPSPPLTRLSPIVSMHDITETEKIKKLAAFKWLVELAIK